MSNRRRNLTRTIQANAQIRAARAAIGEHKPSGQGYPGPGCVNAYRCADCRGLTVTVHRDAGITPATIACPAHACEGHAITGYYRTPKNRLPEPTHEWYLPPADRWLAPGVRTHVAQGVLLLRPVAA